jgi:hypothetical protein
MNGRNIRPADLEDRGSGASPLRVLSAPLALGVLSAVGLISALLGDGLWDVLSWFLLALPVAATIRYLARDLGVGVHPPWSSSPADRSTQVE